MTTPSTERKAGPLLGTGAQTTWPFTFKVFAATDIAVTIADSLGVETALTYGVDYTVTLNANQETSPGGTVTYPISGSPLPVGSRLVIVGNLPYDQPLDLPSGGNFSPLALENQLDRLTMQIQQLRERLGRALQVSVTTNANATLPAPTANQLIGWNASGSTLQNVPLENLATAVAFATMRFDTFTGDGVQTQFTLSANPAVIGNLDVAIAGVTQTPGTDYTLSSGVLVFSAAPPLGATVLARYGEALPPGQSVGANDVTYSPAGVGALPTTVETKLREAVSVKDFGAVGDGAADDTAAFTAAFASGKKTVYAPAGVYRITSTITVPDYYSLVGDGYTSENSTGGRAATVILKNFNGTGVVVMNCSGLENIQVEGAPGNTGDGVQIKGERAVAQKLCANKHGGDGVRIGADNDGTINVNLWRLDSIVSMYNGRHGVYIHHGNSNIEASYPQGAPAVNAGTGTHFDLRSNGGDGLRIGNAIDNKFYGVVAQVNTGYGVHYLADARGHNIYGLYTEANTAGELLLEPGANDNVVQGNRAVTNASGWVDQGTRNFLLDTHSAVPDSYILGKRIALANLGAGGLAIFDLYADVNGARAASLIGKAGAGTGGAFVLQTKRNGNTPVDRLIVDESGMAVLLNTAGFAIGKTANDTTTAGIYLGDSGSSANTRINMVGSGSSTDTKFAFYNANGQVGSITTSGTSTAYSVSSDYRLKEDVQPIDGAAALAAVMSWPIKSFTWKATGAADVGVIAHELQAVKPSAVSGEKDAMRGAEIDPQGVDYSKLVPELAAAVQHLASLVEELRSK